MAQRWLGVSSQGARERAEASSTNACQREAAAINKPRLHLHAKRFETPEAAQAALAPLETSWQYPQVGPARLLAPNHYAGKGRPTPTSAIQSIAWQRQAQARPAQAQMAYHKACQACFVVGPTMAPSQRSDPEVIRADKSQAQAEGGFRFLTDPLLFVSSLLVKKPCRMQGLLRVMTGALLVSAVTQRRLRQHWAHHTETVPNQRNQPTERPTLRWVFQLLAGMHRVRVTVQGQVHNLIEGLNEVKITILRLFGEEVCRLYQISPG